MNAHLSNQPTAIEQALINKKLKEIQKADTDTMLRDFRMGAHAVAKLALNTYEELIRSSTTFEELQKNTFDLLKQLRWALLPEQEQREKESEVKADANVTN